MNAAILEAINASGEAFLIHTELGGEFTMRLAIGATNQQVGRELRQQATLSQNCTHVPTCTSWRACVCGL